MTRDPRRLTRRDAERLLDGDASVDPAVAQLLRTAASGLPKVTDERERPAAAASQPPSRAVGPVGLAALRRLSLAGKTAVGVAVASVAAASVAVAATTGVLPRLPGPTGWWDHPAAPVTATPVTPAPSASPTPAASDVGSATPAATRPGPSTTPPTRTPDEHSATHRRATPPGATHRPPLPPQATAHRPPQAGHHSSRTGHPAPPAGRRQHTPRHGPTAPQQSHPPSHPTPPSHPSPASPTTRATPVDPTPDHATTPHQGTPRQGPASGRRS